MRLQIAPALLLCALASCTVPSLTDLEKERPRACDDTHRCAAGYDCVANVCQKGSAPITDCTAGATEACGNDKGECTPGQRTCQANGTWGSCIGEVGPVTEVCDGKDNDCDEKTDEEAITAACGDNFGVCAGAKKACDAGVEETSCPASRYGTDFQLGSENRCDGKDNDCDNETDENLFASCGVDAGVCAGATQSCRDGGFGGCTTADFLARSAAYEPYESKCDTNDNDCDGRTDTWASRIISDGGTGLDGGLVTRRAPVGVAIPDAGSGSQRDVLAFYEDGTKVVMRQLRADGSIGPPTPPATAGLRDWAPTLATDGTTVVAAWFNEIAGGGGSKVQRLSIGLPRPDGTSIINGSPGATSINMTGPGVSVSAAVAAGRVALAWHWDESGTSRISLANCPLNFSTACGITTLATTNVKEPRVAINPSGLEQYVVYEAVGGGNRVSLVVADYSTSRSGVPTLTAGTALPVSQQDNEREGWVFFNAGSSQLRLYTFTAAHTAIKRRTCSIPCTALDNGSTAVSTTWPLPAASFAITVSGSTTLAAIEGAFQGTSTVAYEDLGPGGGTFVTANDFNTRTYRPWPVITSTGTFTLLYDSESAPNGSSDVVLARRFCGP